MNSLVVLVDGSVRAPGLLAQHGFAALVRAPGGDLLFDAGATESVLKANAEALGIDLGALAAVALSHGHWDHGGGLGLLLDASPRARFLLPAGCLLPRFHGRGEQARDIALPERLRARLVRARGRWTEVGGPVEVFEGVWLTGPIPGARPEAATAGLWRNRWLDVPDDVPEEQALVLEGGDGLVAVSGCGHYGLANLLDRIAELFPGRPLRGLVGGLHLERADSATLDGIVDRLRASGVRWIRPSHCTGLPAVVHLAAGLGGEPRPTVVGETIDWGRP